MRNVLSQVMNFIKTGLEVRAKMLLHVAPFLQHLQNVKLIKYSNIQYHMKEYRCLLTEKTCLNPLFQTKSIEMFLLRLLAYLSYTLVLKILDSKREMKQH